MEEQWFIGTVARISEDKHGRRHSSVSLAVSISRDEHGALREAASSVRRTLRGALFRLVFSNHGALTDLLAQMHEVLTSRDRRRIDWSEAHLQTQLALANWLGSVRWLLDHTKKRLNAVPKKLGQFEDATRHEFDNHFAYRLTYKLHDYSTHCDLPPISLNTLGA